MSLHVPTLGLTVTPFEGSLGADIEGVDLRTVDGKDFEKISRAWADHLVLRFRHQSLDDIHLMEFSRRFGQLDRVPIRRAGRPTTTDPRLQVASDAIEYVTVISNVELDGKPIGGLGNYEAHWHTDMSYQAMPPIGSLLYAIEVPPSGGDTSFANMYEAYEQLSSQMRSRLEKLTCIHDASRNSAGELRRGFQENNDPTIAVGARHPLIRVHPISRRRCLFLGRRRNAYIPELTLAESESLLNELWTRATDARLCWTQIWNKGDVVLWDNRCTMHRRDEFDNKFERIMHRTQISADHPTQ